MFDRYDHTTAFLPHGVGAPVVSVCCDRAVLYIGPDIPTGGVTPIDHPCFGMIGFLCHLDEGVGVQKS